MVLRPNLQHLLPQPEYHAKLLEMGFPEDKLIMTLPGVDNEQFNPRARDLSIWEKHGIKETSSSSTPAGSALKRTFPSWPTSSNASAEPPRCRLGHRRRRPLPHRHEGQTRRASRILPRLPRRHHPAGLYASSDLFVFPSETDTLGQVVIEAQAAGLPVLVSTKAAHRKSWTTASPALSSKPTRSSGRKPSKPF